MLDSELVVIVFVLLLLQQVVVGDLVLLLCCCFDVCVVECMLVVDMVKIGQVEVVCYLSLKLFGVIGLGGMYFLDLMCLDDFVVLGVFMLSWNFFDFGCVKVCVM